MDRLAPDPTYIDDGSKSKDSPGGLHQDRDSGFSSAEYDLDNDLHSPAGSSDVETRLRPAPPPSTPPSSGKRQKRAANDEATAAKRRKRKKDGDDTDDPFRPWGGSDEQQPLSLVLRTESEDTSYRPQDVVRLGSKKSAAVAGCSSSSNSSSSPSNHKPDNNSSNQRNYKNMTRERRIEANARERTRVHTISAAFDTLRRCVPAYSHSQKLSKLSVLRIACAYILTLSRVAGDDYSADHSQPSLADCVDNVSKTIQMEGKLRKKKDE
ncbi:protein atonal homolog 8 [Nilaparvata lugens]|uniref:protein atonal homolog 8 n=1 Tax=Nilaparvata lugens TaxID=108931 RepID=UPI00193DD770|nr:protein atonal homolog 8 [Nilaparvata lugens]